jgi:hypothetical protein
MGSITHWLTFYARWPMRLFIMANGVKAASSAKTVLRIKHGVWWIDIPQQLIDLISGPTPRTRSLHGCIF